ncbi:hypothetical protein CU103_22740 [Phyllobacterium sophorae]|uniref:Transposase n=1 Tax=Phyllobacterium sophorae TaxID=1520277 RepID=A0A2P7B577_9HYPH|nr:hypothetical protein CU103_22740 [Phyllobacterium sophorae]
MGVGLLCSQAKSIAASVNQRFDRLVFAARTPRRGVPPQGTAVRTLQHMLLRRDAGWQKPGDLPALVRTYQTLHQRDQICAYTMVAMKKCARHDGRAHGLLN